MKMKTKNKILVAVGLFTSVLIVSMGAGTCILVAEGAPNDWLGSNNGCGPMLTYIIHDYFGIFW